MFEPTRSRRDAASVIFNQGLATRWLARSIWRWVAVRPPLFLIEIITDWEVLRDDYTRLSGA